MNKDQFCKVLRWLFLYDFYLIAYKHQMKKVLKLHKKGFISSDEFKTICKRIENKFESHLVFSEGEENHGK